MTEPNSPSENEMPADDAQETTGQPSADSNEVSGDAIAFELELASLREQLEAAAAERDANADKALRAQAESENVRRRASKELQEQRDYQSLPIVRDLVPGLDNLQRAITAAENSGSIEELMQGLKMVVSQFEETLSRHGAKPIECAGKPFDPNLHEALQQVPSAEHPPMTVMQEVERGYTLKDRVVRPSKVIVSCAPPQPAE